MKQSSLINTTEGRCESQAMARSSTVSMSLISLFFNPSTQQISG
ncbi:hypothetical protein ECDEC12E_2366 [Escherichia coli DEC12E]|nr:hypothetical protein ECDEC12E_2366 [Escherichia coli DEC12E]